MSCHVMSCQGLPNFQIFAIFWNFGDLPIMTTPVWPGRDHGHVAQGLRSPRTRRMRVRGLRNPWATEPLDKMHVSELPDHLSLLLHLPLLLLLLLLLRLC